MGKDKWAGVSARLSIMSGDGPKSAYELAMERLRQKDKEASVDDRPLTDEQKAAIKAQVPLGRYGSAEDIAETVLWLTGPGAAYVTGAVIPVDGGLGMGH